MDLFFIFFFFFYNNTIKNKPPQRPNPEGFSPGGFFCVGRRLLWGLCLGDFLFFFGFLNFFFFFFWLGGDGIFFLEGLCAAPSCGA